MDPDPRVGIVKIYFRHENGASARVIVEDGKEQLQECLSELHNLRRGPDKDRCIETAPFIIVD